MKEIIYKYTPLPEKIKERLKFWFYRNVLWKIYHFKMLRKYGQKDFFDTISIEPSTYCNLRCDFCPNYKHERGLLENKVTMPSDLFKKIIDELKELNYEGTILFDFYNEPLTDERLPEFISYINNILPKSKVIIMTNGILLNVEIFKKLARYGVVNHLEASQHSTTMPKGLREVLEFVEKNPKFKNKIFYRVFHRNELSEGSVMYNVGGEVEVDKIPSKPQCYRPPYKFIIDANGNVPLCCLDYHTSKNFGNIKNNKLIDIWNNPNYKIIRERLKKGIYDLKICKRCVGMEKGIETGEGG